MRRAAVHVAITGVLVVNSGCKESTGDAARLDALQKRIRSACGKGAALLQSRSVMAGGDAAAMSQLLTDSHPWIDLCSKDRPTVEDLTTLDPESLRKTIERLTADLDHWRGAPKAGEFDHLYVTPP